MICSRILTTVFIFFAVPALSQDMFVRDVGPNDDLINQGDTPMGAILLRSNSNVAGGGYGVFNATVKSKEDSTTYKLKIDNTVTSLYAAMVLPVNVRLGAALNLAEQKYKMSEYKATVKSQRISLTAAGAMSNGFGAALILRKQSEEVSASLGSYKAPDEDADWGMLLPELFYANDMMDVILRTEPTQRHETTNNTAKIEAALEVASGDVHPVLTVAHHRPSEVRDGDKNYFSVEAGARFLMPEAKTNILATVAVNEASNRDPASANDLNIATWQVDVAAEMTVASAHTLGARVAYAAGSGKGEPSRSGSRSKVSVDGLGIAGSYAFRF